MLSTDGRPSSAGTLLSEATQPDTAPPAVSPATAGLVQPALPLASPSQEFRASLASAEAETQVATDATRQALEERLRALGLATPINGGAASSITLGSDATPEADEREDADEEETGPEDDAKEACEPHPSGLYCIYTVKAGDTLSAIAATFGLKGSGELPPAEMLAQSNKPAVADSDSIAAGLQLRIPAQNGIIHTVFSSETLASVAERYGVDPAAIQAIALNGIDESSVLVAGQEILVPDPAYVASPPPPENIAGLAAGDEPQEQSDGESEPATLEEPAEEEPTATPPPDTPTPEPETPTPEPETPTPEAEATATATPEPELASEFSSGDKVYVTGGGCLNVRQFPGLDQEINDCLPVGTQVVLAQGPVEADGYLWWEVKDGGGWLVDDYLTDERPRATPTPRPRATATARPSQPSAAGFIWPAQGPISSYFGAGHPLGIDIDFYNNPNQPVVAAAAGTVSFAGGNPCCSYGYYVIIDHGNGWSTLYGHFSAFADGLSAGDRVAQGEVIGYGGMTGYATGYHLHFEMHYNGSIVDPLDFLP